jgi:signal transduction histidine kinase
VNGLLDDISLLFTEEVTARSVMMHRQGHRKLPLVVMDKGKMTQALINIVTNSLHAMEEGGNLTLRAERDRKDWVRITISDTGTGIPEEQIEKIFDYSYTTREKGLGLGLPIVHKIVEEHGGRIRVESKVGQGTMVFVFLPIKGPRGSNQRLYTSEGSRSREYEM